MTLMTLNIPVFHGLMGTWMTSCSNKIRKRPCWKCRILLTASSFNEIVHSDCSKFILMGSWAHPAPILQGLGDNHMMVEVPTGR